MKRYKTILADPPWPERGAGKIKRGADRHYPLMTIAQICDLRSFIERISQRDCHLYLWATNNYLAHGIHVLTMWGFRYITTITWLKDRMGLGQYFRGKTEHCLFGVKGKFQRQGQGTTGFYAKRKGHSLKPVELIKMAEKVSFPPRIELFAREKRDGWDSWGQEI